jgi:hypothetical protein
MNPLTGTLARSSASLPLISPFLSGPIAVSSTSLYTGAMMKNVMRSASPIITWFGGICCKDSAFRTNASTTTTLVKHVKSTKMAGANVSTVNKSII